jgi:hypothetical protein
VKNLFTLKEDLVLKATIPIWKVADLNPDEVVGFFSSIGLISFAAVWL